MSTKDMFMRLQLQLADKVSGPLGKISHSTKLNSEALKANRNHLRNLEKATGLIQKLKREQEAFKRTNTEMRKNQAELIALKKSGSASAAQIKAQTSLVKSNSAAFEAQKKKLVDLRRVAADAGIKNLTNDEKRLAAEIKNTTQQITRQDSALRRMDQLRANRNRALGQTAALGGAGVGMRMIGQRGLNVSRSILSQGMDFDTGMAALQGQLNLTGNSQDLKRLRETVLSLPTKQAGDVTEAMKALVSAGMNIDQVISSMPALISAADASLMGMDETAASFAGVMKAFGIDYNQFAQVTDLLVGAGNAGNISISSLNETLARVAPTARAAGLSLNETAAMIGSLNRAGIEASDAGTILNTVIRNLQAPSSSTVKALGALGIKPGMAQDIPELLAMVSQRTGGMTDARQLETLSNVFGNKNAAVMSQLMNQMRTGGYSDVLGQIAGSDGAASMRAAQNTAHFRNAADDLNASLASVGATLFEMNKEWLQEIVVTLKDTVLWVRTWIQANPELVKTLSKIFIGGSALLTVLGSIAIAVAGILAPTIMLKFGLGMLGIKFGGLIPIILNVGKALFSLGAGLMANPLFLAIGLLAGAAYMIYKNWDSFVWFFNFIWEEVSGFFTSGIDNITATIVNWSPIGLFYKAFAEVLSWFGVDLPETFTGFGKMLMDGLVNGITGAMGAVKDSITNMGNNVLGWFKDKLGIKSPSKVFMNAGVEISNGAALGIQKGFPVMRKTSLALADEAGNSLPHFDGNRFVTVGGAVRIDNRAPIAAGASGGAPVTIGGDTIHFHITGTDPHTIQQAVEAALEKHNRMKLARARSSYNDR